MVLVSIRSMILFVLFIAVDSCDVNQIFCSDSHLSSLDLTWCCPDDQRCGQNYKQCQSQSTIKPSTYLITMIFMVVVSVFLYRCVLICLSYRNVQNENWSIGQYETVVMSSGVNSSEEESPPSYEEVMNAGDRYRFANVR